MIPQWQTGTQEVAPGIFAYVQAGGGLCIANAGVIAAPEGATVVDALFTPAMTRALLDETRRVAGTEIRRLINTHHHVDHTLGNALFPADTQVLAHIRAKLEMQRVGLGVLDVIRRVAPRFAPELEGVARRLPDTTFDGKALELEVGGRSLRLLHLGTGHTRGDVLVHLPVERVLFAGDVAFFYVTPLGFEGHLGHWIEVCRQVEAMSGVDVIVPGHGPVGGMGDLAIMRRYLERIYEAARAASEAGVSAGEAARSVDLGEYAEWAEPDRVALNVARVYQELRGELDGAL